MADDTSIVQESKDSTAESDDNNDVGQVSAEIAREKEVGGRDGPDPTRYGDWEKNGRCIDF
jgi:hypothetical protein